MFNLKNFKLVKELKDIKPKIDWLKFSNAKNKATIPSDLLSNSSIEKRFLDEDLKIRALVEEMLVKEFSPKIKEKSSYNFLVDSVVNRLKQKQLGDIKEPEQI